MPQGTHCFIAFQYFVVQNYMHFLFKRLLRVRIFCWFLFNLLQIVSYGQFTENYVA